MNRARPTRLIAATVWAVVVLDILAVTAVLVGVIPEPPTNPAGGTWVFLFLTVVYGVVAGRVVTAQPGNVAGWLIWLQPTLIALSGAGSGYAVLSVESYGGHLPGTALLVWASGLGLLLFIGIGLLIEPLVFPDGRLPSRRWRPAMVIAIAATAGICVGSGEIFTPGPMAGFPTVVNPFGLPMGQAITDLVTPVAILLVFVAMILAVTAVVVRFRRGSPTERQQAKWFAAGVAVPALLLALALALGPFVADATVVWVASIAALGLIPVSIGIAILRYRLYEIDRIISRTVGWAVVTGLLVGVFALAVIALQAVLAGVTQGQTLAVAGSTLVAFALFQPLRRRVQRAVDRRFDRTRITAADVQDGFGRFLRSEIDLARIGDALVASAGGELRPDRAALWLRNPRPNKAVEGPHTDAGRTLPSSRPIS